MVGNGATAAAKSAPADTFRIKKVEGQVWTRRPFDVAWRPVKVGQQVKLGTLLQVGMRSKVGFDYLPPKIAGEKQERVLVSVKTPLVVRLDRDLLRTTKVSSQFLEPPAADTAPDSANGAPLVGQLRQAWQKFVASVTSDAAAEKTANAIEERRKSGKIDILRPAIDSLVGTNSPASGVLVVWRGVKDPTEVYNLKVWHVDDQEPRDPIAQTRSTEFLVKLNRLGRHHISVSTASGKWRSAVSSFDLVTVGGGLNGYSYAKVIDDLQLKLPPDNFLVSGAPLPFYLDCSWTDALGMSGTTLYEVLVRDESRRVRARLSTRQQSARIFLPVAGAYTWQVKAVQGGRGGELLTFRTSAERNLTLESKPMASAGTGTLGQRLQAMLKTPGNRVLMLEHGL